MQVIQVEDIPYTLNGKRVEVLVKKVKQSLTQMNGCLSLNCQIINGAPLSSVNPATLSNPECLSFYAEIRATLLRDVDKA